MIHTVNWNFWKYLDGGFRNFPLISAKVAVYFDKTCATHLQTYIRIAETVGIIRLVGAKRKRIEKQRRSERHGGRKRRRRKADNTLQGQAVFKCVRYYCFCSCRLPVRRNIFTDCSRGCRTTVIFFSSHRQAFSLFLSPSSTFILHLQKEPLPLWFPLSQIRAAQKPTPLSLFAYITKLYYSLSGNIATQWRAENSTSGRTFVPRKNTASLPGHNFRSRDYRQMLGKRWRPPRIPGTVRVIARLLWNSVCRTKRIAEKRLVDTWKLSSY